MISTSRGGGWVIVQALLMLAVLAAGPLAAGDWNGLWSLVAGGLLFAAGGAVGLAGGIHLGENLTAFPRPKEDAQLVESGIYRWVRHPLYLSVMLASWAWALLFQSAAAGICAALIVLFLDAKARREECWLRATFPGYEAYARRVNRFVPGLY